MAQSDHALAPEETFLDAYALVQGPSSPIQTQKTEIAHAMYHSSPNERRRTGDIEEEMAPEADCHVGTKD
ncbi:hypothetical protein BX666DRAFT_2031071 [Dichotomocladium elegans]|nr:hypothetical protein BX666DRAFT_2031071 [Dichotomocladium elegans]